jgi:1,2-phenylacetyl-CoA epoxidase catalytic subunit
MAHTKAALPKHIHDAVIKWRDTFLPDYEFLIDNWDRHFPNDQRFELCAYRETGMCNEIECGEMKGTPKYTKAGDMVPEQAAHLFGAIRAQASTEFGSIQQHRLTLARAQEEEEQFWVLRMMAEELRHGYQMLHLLSSDDWASVSSESGEQLVEDILSMQTGSHILGAFNIDFDSFVDNVVFCCLIDRVGKYQLSMQKISAYKPMAESMPQMLREEAFHLATGVVPMRRWVERAARGSVYITMSDMQKALNKWFPRGLEMFGDERGGATNVKYGLKPMKNDEAQAQYIEEVQKVVRDLNVRYVRARLPGKSAEDVGALIGRVMEQRATVEGIAYEDLLKLPHPEFFRRRGVPAFTMVGVDGERFSQVADYRRHLVEHLPDAYRAGEDFRDYLDALERVVAGTLALKEAVGRMPSLRRVAGACPCSKAVRWVADAPGDDSAKAAPHSPRS